MEKPPMPPTPPTPGKPKESAPAETWVERADRQDKENEENGTARLARIEAEELPLEAKLDCEPLIAEFETFVTAFEAAHSLEALHAVTFEDLAPERVDEKYIYRNPIREAAFAAHIPIGALLNKLKHDSNIPQERFAQLHLTNKRLTQAIGILNIYQKKLDHTR